TEVDAAHAVVSAAHTRVFVALNISVAPLILWFTAPIRDCRNLHGLAQFPRSDAPCEKGDRDRAALARESCSGSGGSPRWQHCCSRERTDAERLSVLSPAATGGQPWISIRSCCRACSSPGWSAGIFCCPRSPSAWPPTSRSWKECTW